MQKQHVTNLRLTRPQHILSPWYDHLIGMENLEMPSACDNQALQRTNCIQRQLPCPHGSIVVLCVKLGRWLGKRKQTNKEILGKGLVPIKLALRERELLTRALIMMMHTSDASMSKSLTECPSQNHSILWPTSGHECCFTFGGMYTWSGQCLAVGHTATDKLFQLGQRSLLSQ